MWYIMGKATVCRMPPRRYLAVNPPGCYTYRRPVMGGSLPVTKMPRHR
ncbi:MAG: hypothetical protein LBB84_12200 [Tannerellaceae bacterium]|nr:hypothetical protein [Tannerellaceae bacterium]